VVVIERDAQANGASIRNFGFVTVTGQQRGERWRRAVRSRDVWSEVAPAAGIRIEHRGLAVAVRRPEAVAVLETFRSTEMGEGCELLPAREAFRRFPMLAGTKLRAVLWSPHELRVESREAIPALARWLAEAAEQFAAYGLRRCKLHMMRVSTPAAMPRFTAAVMSDLGLVRYLGYAELPEAATLKHRLEAEQPLHLANGMLASAPR
jgi:D-hydroxyproline dehydrogenase subunit beta